MGPAVKEATAVHGDLGPGSPALKEERYPGRRALVPYGSYPIGMEGPRTGAGFATE
jgi:hypothetical protein